MHVSGFELWELSPVSTVLCSTNINSLYIYRVYDRYRELKHVFVYYR
jgi:hypothetical protein